MLLKIKWFAHFQNTPLFLMHTRKAETKRNLYAVVSVRNELPIRVRGRNLNIVKLSIFINASPFLRDCLHDPALPGRDMKRDNFDIILN
jgi:hypothetical protein